MEWIVKIEDETNQRIKVEFLVELEKLRFGGEYKPKNNNNQWETFSQVDVENKTTLEEIQTAMSVVVEAMKKRILVYEDIAKVFTVLKEVAFNEEPED